MKILKHIFIGGLIATGFLLSPLSAKAALTDNLISYWKLDESSGNAADSVGSNTAVNTNVTYSTGKINNGAVFNGSTAKLVISDNASMEVATGSFSFWFKPNSTLNNTTALTYFIDKGNTYFGAEIGTDGKLKFRIYDGTIHDIKTSQASWTGGTWYFVVLQWGSSGQKIYINGSLDGSDVTTAGYTNVANSWDIGTNSDTNWWNGMIDEMAFWSRALTSTEVTSLYNAGAGCQHSFSSCESTATSVPILGLVWSYIF